MDLLTVDVSSKLILLLDDGKMNNQKREKSLSDFRKDESISVLLISLKCGALGLNLIVANHVIMMDMWW